MFLKLPFLGLLSSRSPMDGLVKHYDKIAECIQIINNSVECYVAGNDTCKAFEELVEQIDIVEAEADKIKRNIRNHLPRSLFMAVDKTFFFTYTRRQDNILDAAQDALHWLGMRRVAIPSVYQKDIIHLLSEVNEAATKLGPALHATIDLINGSSLDREETKTTYRAVRKRRDSVRILAKKITRNIYSSDMDFKDIYQLIHFISDLEAMAHNAEGCADILRAMIAR